MSIINEIEDNVYDVIIVGAGISGIGAAYHILNKCHNKKIALLEGRASIGGTWDLFKYPGIRSDSDMQTLGFSFNPWKNPKAIADGPSILEYIKQTSKRFGIDKYIKFNHSVKAATWSDTENLWTIEIQPNPAITTTLMKCKFLFMCSGYYNYAKGFCPEFPQSELFKGAIIHPQRWDTNLNYDNKNVVVIGSGATAITIAPEMAKKANKVVLLQRSPTYIINMPSEDIVANSLRKVLPENLAYSITRWKNIFIGIGLYNACRKWPNFMRNIIQKGIKKEIGELYDIKHFNPKYNPWDQRLCMVPDSDLFKSIKEKKVEIETDTIEEFTPNGILLKSGKELEADIIVTATGLNVQLFGGMTITVNDKRINTKKLKTYRGVMFSDLPNFAFALGYTNASWTLKSDLNCHYVTRLINFLDENKLTKITPIFDKRIYKEERLFDFDAGYVLRAEGSMPKQGSKSPWRNYQNYIKDSISLKYGKISDGCLVFK